MRGDADDRRAPTDGRRARWADHRAGRRDELIDATVAAVRRHGASVGMDQIAAEAHTSKPVIYRYFTDKSDLYRAVGGRVADELLVEIAAATTDEVDPRERVRAGVDAFFLVLERNPELYRFVVAYPMLEGALGGGRNAPRPRGEDMVADYISRVEDLVSRLLVDQQGVDLPVATARLWGTCIVGLVRAAGDHWLADRAQAARDGVEVFTARTGSRPLSRAELTDQVTTLVWSGVVGGLLAPLEAARREAVDPTTTTEVERT
ncbi:TetR family transcriptional regulator [Jatrophihabitans sp. YIM 134969]